MLFYYFGSPWRKLLVGRSLMYFAASLALITVIVLLSLFLGPDYVGREFVRIICYGLVSFTTWRLFWTLRKVQKESPLVSKEEGTGVREPEDVENKENDND